MAVLLEYSVTGGGVRTDDSIISSPCSTNETKDREMHELFCLHLNYDGTFDVSSREFYSDISWTSTPSAARSSELRQRRDYDTDDSGFGESLVSDSDLLQMSNLNLGDESQCENATRSRRSDIFPVPKLRLLPHFDEYCDLEAASAAPTSYEQYDGGKNPETVRKIPCERVSVRRQRSPDAAVERCSRHRLSLDSFSESRSEDHRPIRRSSDSFVPAYSSDDVFANPPPLLSDDPLIPTADYPLQANLPPPTLYDPVQHTNLSSPPAANELVSHVGSPSLPHKIPPRENKSCEPSPVDDDRVFSPSLHVNQVLDPSPPVTDVDTVLEEGLRCILSECAPPCLEKLIGRKMGLDYVDIVAELCDRSMSVIIRHICSYLTDADLCSMLLVSVKWISTVTADRLLMSRVKAHNSRHRIVTKQHTKENVTKSKAPTRASVTRPLASTTADVARPLISLTALTNRTSSSSSCGVARTSKSVANVNKLSSCSMRAMQFWKEVERLYGGETLTKCPRCRGPSRTDPVQERGRCTSVGCELDFCLLCLLPYHNAQPCKASTPTVGTSPDCYIGSRKRRRQLRRL